MAEEFENCFKVLHQAQTFDRPLDSSLENKALEELSQKEDNLISPESLKYLELLQRKKSEVRPLSLGSKEDVIVIPGFMGSRLSDVKGNLGLIWIDPFLYTHPDQLNSLKLKTYNPTVSESDVDPTVNIQSKGFLPLVYDVLTSHLWWYNYNTINFPVDWRKNLDEAAQHLKKLIESTVKQNQRPLHLIAHSQGSLVARRALQLLGTTDANKLVKSLVLMGPATYGTYSAALALSGSHESFDLAKSLGVNIPDNIAKVFQSFTGLYQLLPCKQGVDPLFPNDPTQYIPSKMADKQFWETGIDEDRLRTFYGWANKIDTTFFNARTTIVLGQQLTTATQINWVNNKMLPINTHSEGDGTVPDSWARLSGVRTYRIEDLSHMRIPSSITALFLLNDLLKGHYPSKNRIGITSANKDDALIFIPNMDQKLLQEFAQPPHYKHVGSGGLKFSGQTEASVKPAIVKPVMSPNQLNRPIIPAPTVRKLRVYSFDPLLATDLDTLNIAELTLDIPWENQQKLTAGPIGEYLEVIDFDPASQCFYPPLDLWEPHLLAQNGMAPSESNPQFHQQMVYAVAMSTIKTFEKALGRVALWSPHLPRDAAGTVLANLTEDEIFVRRLRIYPHALRGANAFYHPGKKALLFGYFPSEDTPGGKTLPGGTIFTCLSYDIIAHEVTHALLDGLHRYLIYPSNPDCHAFHEAFADLVALFQHFSHREILVNQIAKGRGDLNSQTLLGQLAKQFGEAQAGHRGALRDYLGTDSNSKSQASNSKAQALEKTTEPHARGAILVAAMFQAFINIYNHRSRDLYRIATSGSGILNPGEIQPDLVNRLAIEASKSAEHLLRMAVRALDYIPPVDITFGEYLRALITADYDLVKNDDKKYRVAIIDAFRQWGIYPEGVSSLDQSCLLWQSPEHYNSSIIKDQIQSLNYNSWDMQADRLDVHQGTRENAKKLHDSISQNVEELGDGGASLGIMVKEVEHYFPGGFHSIPRNKYNKPKFEIHSVRPCKRIGPNGETLTDLLVEITQKRAGYYDPKIQKMIEEGPNKSEADLVDTSSNENAKKNFQQQYWAFSEDELKNNPEQDSESNTGLRADRVLVPHQPDFWFRGGCTLIINAETGEIRYTIRKSVLNDYRLEHQREYETNSRFTSLAATYLDTNDTNPFALLHQDDVDDNATSDHYH